MASSTRRDRRAARQREVADAVARRGVDAEERRRAHVVRRREQGAVAADADHQPRPGEGASGGRVRRDAGDERLDAVAGERRQHRGEGALVLGGGRRHRARDAPAARGEACGVAAAGEEGRLDHHHDRCERGSSVAGHGPRARARRRRSCGRRPCRRGGSWRGARRRSGCSGTGGGSCRRRRRRAGGGRRRGGRDGGAPPDPG